MKEVDDNPDILWRVRLFDGPILEDAAGNRIQRFRSQRVGALLAYLALHLGRPCPREELYEALWPEEDVRRTPNRLRVALASLRRQMEPPGVAFGSVIDVSTPGLVRLRAEAVWCDMTALEQAVRSGRKERAAQLARGLLLPGYYEEWILTAREQFDTLREELRSVRLPDQPAPQTPPQASLTPSPSPCRLPLYLTRFFGREAEIQQLLVLVTENRLVSLTGPGGIGKTRLTVELAQSVHKPCLFVPLADLPDPCRVAEAVLDVLQISPQADADPAWQLLDVFLRRDPVLLILDNAEHVIDAVVSLSLRLLETVPDLHILVTSRQRLDMIGEANLTLPPLAPPSASTLPDHLIAFPSVALFLDRARNMRPDFKLSPRHTDRLVEICRRLEGVPLALELAAAQVTSHTLAQIAESLSAALTSLTSRQRGHSPRHRSLRAAMEGSLNLLDADLRAFVARLSVFMGGWTIEAAQAVTDCEEAETFLEDLVARSLVVLQEDEATDTMRYSFLETVRQFAAEELPEAERERCAERHRGYFLTLAARVQEDDVRTLAPLDAEQENLIAALEHCRQARTNACWEGITGAVIHAFVRGRHRIAVRWIEEALPHVETVSDPALRFRLRYAACLILPDIGRIAETERVAMAMKEDALANKDPVAEVFAATVQGYVADISGDLQTAVRIQREALRRARELGHPSLLQSCLSLTGGALHSYGTVLGESTPAGMAALQEAETLDRELLRLVPAHSRRASLARLLLAAALIHQHRTDEAYVFLKEAQVIAVASGTMTDLMYAFVYESEIARNRGRFDRSALLFGAFLDLQERMGYSLDRAQSYRPSWIQKLSDDLRAVLGDESYDALVRQGRQTPPGALAALALPPACGLPHAENPGFTL